MKKRIIRLLTGLMVICMALALTGPVQTQAASNKTIHKAYVKKMNKLKAKGSYYVDYRYADLTGDGKHEVIVLYDIAGGSGSNVDVYTYKNGKVKALMKEVIYGASKFKCYRSSKSLVIYSAGHGGETYRYYKIKSGKYKMMASKSRVSFNGGGSENGPWYYYKGTGYTSISKSRFNSLVKPLKNGKSLSLGVGRFKSL